MITRCLSPAPFLLQYAEYDFPSSGFLRVCQALKSLDQSWSPLPSWVIRTPFFHVTGRRSSILHRLRPSTIRSLHSWFRHDRRRLRVLFKHTAPMSCCGCTLRSVVSLSRRNTWAFGPVWSNCGCVFGMLIRWNPRAGNLLVSVYGEKIRSVSVNGRHDPWADGGAVGLLKETQQAFNRGDLPCMGF